MSDVQYINVLIPDTWICCTLFSTIC